MQAFLIALASFLFSKTRCVCVAMTDYLLGKGDIIEERDAFVVEKGRWYGKGSRCTDND